MQKKKSNLSPRSIAAKRIRRKRAEERLQLTSRAWKYIRDNETFRGYNDNQPHNVEAATIDTRSEELRVAKARVQVEPRASDTSFVHDTYINSNDNQLLVEHSSSKPKCIY